MTNLGETFATRDIEALIHTQTNLDLHRRTGASVIARGHGIYVYDEAGTEFLEAASGLWCASLGFENERLAKAAYEQIAHLGYYHTSAHYTHPKAVELSERLLAIAPVKMSKVMFHSTGSEANDFAIKLAWYYQHARGKPAKRKIIGRMRGYHGSTIATVSASGKPDMHEDFALPLPGFLHAECPYYYRMHHPNETEEAFASRMAESLQQLIAHEGAETIAAFIAEPFMGAGGLIFPPRTYFEKVQAVLAKNDILFIVDEVMCGFGRTGKMWGCETYDLRPDLMSCAKAISAGFQPLSATFVSEPIYEAMLSQSRKLGNFAHSSTYSGHPVAVAVALETLNIYDEMDMLSHVKAVGDHMQQRFQELRSHPLVGCVEGVGMATAIEIVADRTTRAEFPASTALSRRLAEAGKRRGILFRMVGNRLLLSPPLITTTKEINKLFGCVEAVIHDVASELRA